MAALKISFAFVLLIIASNYNPACGQAQRTPQDFWVTFAELMAQDVATWFTNLHIFDDPMPAVPATAPAVTIIDPSQRIVTINGQQFIIPAPAAPAPVAPATAPTPAVPAMKEDPINDFLRQFYQLYSGRPNVNSPMPMPMSMPMPKPSVPAMPAMPTPAPPCGTTTPKPCSDCKPEQVRIVVVDDCNDKKSSSESCSEESSEEVDIIVPRERHGRRY